MNLRITIFLLLLVPVFVTAQTLKFPEDDGRHKSANFEAWALFTHLTADDTTRFGVAVFFFTGKVIGLSASGVYVVVANQNEETYQNYKKIQWPLINRATHTRDSLMEKYGDNILRHNMKNDRYETLIDIDDLQLLLTLKPQKAAVDLGRLQVGENKYNRIYIIPRGRIRAEMQFRNKKYTLDGIGIFQHQWGDSPDRDAVSNLFALHLEDGSDAVIYFNNKYPAMNMLVISDANDSISSVKDFNARADTVYEVMSTQDRFSLNWQIGSSATGIEFNLQPTFDGQDVSLLGKKYWLSRCQVKGTLENKSSQGVGYIYIRATE